jgi:hypothetical protein
MPPSSVPILRAGLPGRRACPGPAPGPPLSGSRTATHAPGRRARDGAGRIGALVLAQALAPLRALADHPGGATPSGGVDWTTWLLAAGALVAIGLAAWAFLAPERTEPPAAEPAPPGDSRPSGPRS